MTPPLPQGHVISGRGEQPLDELTSQVWLLYHHPNFKYCIFYVSWQNYRRTDKLTDGRTIQLLDAPKGPFSRGHKNKLNTKVYRDRHTDVINPQPRIRIA